MQNTYNYAYWDSPDFSIPKEYELDTNSSLADALTVFFKAGGYDFFEVIDPKYYSDKWLDFVGNLYADIMANRYLIGKSRFVNPLTSEQKQSLIEQGVLEVFVSDF